MTNTEYIPANYDDVYVVGDIIDSSKLKLYGELPGNQIIRNRRILGRKDLFRKGKMGFRN